jgi:hypothetical protein
LIWWNSRRRTGKHATRMTDGLQRSVNGRMRGPLTSKRPGRRASDGGGSRRRLSCQISSPPSSTFTHPQLQPYHTQIGALCHYRASNWSLTIRLTSSPLCQAGLKLLLAHFRKYATHLHPSSYSPFATTYLLRLTRVHRERISTSMTVISSTLAWCTTSCLMNPSPKRYSFIRSLTPMRAQSPPTCSAPRGAAKSYVLVIGIV